MEAGAAHSHARVPARIRMHLHTRAWQPRKARAQVLRKELDWALKSLEASETGKAALEAQLAALQVTATAGGRARVLWRALAHSL